MKSWDVILPITGFISVQVEAETEKEAIDKALDQPFKAKDIDEFNPHKIVCEGNVFHGDHNEAYAELIDDGEDN